MPDADADRLGEPGNGDVRRAIALFEPHLRARRTVIQAGGRIGVWPIAFSAIFRRVWTFEPHPENFHCLQMNIASIRRITAHEAALVGPGTDSVTVHSRERANLGASYVTPGGDVRAMRIDDLWLDDVDLIYLDVEGYEYEALQGARETIARCRPLIGVECKHGLRYGVRNLPKRVRTEFKYREIGRPTKWDVVMEPC